jgi:hypothetical protein
MLINEYNYSYKYICISTLTHCGFTGYFVYTYMYMSRSIQHILRHAHVDIYTYIYRCIHKYRYISIYVYIHKNRMFSMYLFATKE